MDSRLLSLDGCLTISQVLGATLTKTSDSLCPLTPDNMSGYKDAADAEAETEESADSEPEAASAPDIKVDGAVTTIRGGKVVISIKEGKDIYLELPI